LSAFVRYISGALLAAALLAPGAAGALLVAERITEANAQERLIGGPDAIGGVGDWYLANDVVEVIVDDPGRRHAKLNHGGTIVDAGLRGRPGDDQFARLFPVVNMDQRVLLNYDTVWAEVDPGGAWARLVVSSSRGMSAIARGSALARWFDLLVPATEEIEKVFAETEYRVFPGEPFVHIRTTLRNEGDRPAPVFAYGDVWMRGGRSMRSFVGNTLWPDRSRGFHHRSFDHRDMLTASEAMAPFTFVAMAGLPRFAPVAYAIFTPERAGRKLLNFGVTGEHVTLLNTFTSDPDWEEASLLRILAATREELSGGAAWSFERRLLVSGGDDIAAATDVIFPLLGRADGSSGVAGRVVPADVRAAVHVEAVRGGAPVTQIATATEGPEAGRYRAVLPPGGYVLTLRAEHREARRVSVSVEAGRFTEVPLQRFEETGFMRFDPAFADGGPGRLIVSGVGERRDPTFGAELLDFRIDGEPVSSGTETNEIHFVGNDRDPTRVALPPGRYRITATRGPEFEIAQVEIEVPGSGAEVRVEPFELRRVVALRGTVSGDFHVHAQASDDSGMGNEARLRSYVAEYVDVMVTSDHDHLADFEPALEALGLRDRIRVLQGVEVTSSAPSGPAPWTIGHHNVWPIPRRPTAHRRGAPPSQNLIVAELYARLRSDYGAQVVQLNHPFGNEPGLVDESYFTHLGSAGEPYDPARPIDAAPNRLLLERASDGRTRAIDFDAIEVMNGASFEKYRRGRDAWYSLLKQGFRRTATGNSDSHGPDQTAAYPRNYVYVDREDFDPQVFDVAIREGRLFATTGPLIAAFRANDAGIGETAAAPDGRVRVQLAVAAAPWVPVDEVRLLVNGEVVRVYRDLVAAEKVMRLLRTDVLDLERDAFLTLEAGAPLDADPERWRAERGGVYASVVAPGFVAQAISNPIYVDVDGDGRFAAPGLAPPDDAGGASRRLVVTLLLLLLLAVVWWRLRVRAGLQGIGL
jgi:hypothetical protein